MKGITSPVSPTAMADPMTDTYGVFQTETSPFAEEHEVAFQTGAPARYRFGAFGFLGRVLDGCSLVALTMFMTLMAFTGSARADETLLASATSQHSAMLMLALLAMFAAMLAMVRRTWRQTTSTFSKAPRRSARVG
jgi:hypothetical protein